MNNKKIIFGILIFCAISFVAYTFANPLEKEDDEGKLIPGNNSEVQNNDNKTNDKNNDATKVDSKVDNKDDITKLEGNTSNNGSSQANNQTNTSTRPSGSNSNSSGSNNRPTTPSNPSGGNSGQNQGNTTPVDPTPTPDPEYRINVSVTNGTSSSSSKVVKKGESAEFTITPNNGYMIYGATVTGEGCVLNGNKLTVSNVTNTINCEVNLPVEPLYGSVLVDNENIKVSQNNNIITFTGSVMELEEFADLDQFDIAKSNIVFTAPRIFTESELKNMKITIGNNTYNSESLANKESAFEGTSKAYFVVAFKYAKGDTKEVVINWGNGREVTYKLNFDIEVEKFRKE